MYDSLQKHIRDGWNFLSHVIGEYIECLSSTTKRRRAMVSRNS
jgi:ADP-glucose pyrophosphorylase